MRNETHQEQHPDKGRFVVDRLILSGVVGGIGGAAVGLALALSYLSRRSGSNGMPLLDMDHMLLIAAFAALGGMGIGQLLRPRAMPHLRWLALCAITNPVAVVLVGTQIGQIGQPPPPPTNVVTSVPNFNRVVVDRNIAYLIGSTDVDNQRIDLSDPRNPRALGKGLGLDGHDDLATTALEMQIADGLAYIVAEGQGLLVADLRDPARPNVLGKHRTPEVELNGGLGYARLSVDGGRAALVARGGLTLLDVRDPASITPLAQRASTFPRRDTDVVLVGNRVYLLHSEGMEIIEYDASGTLRVLGSVALPNSERVKIAGDRAYVIAKKSFHIINVSDPARPAPLGVLDDEYRFIDLAAEGTRVYLLGLAGTELWVVDASDPARPDVLSHRNVSFSGAFSLALHQGIAYISSYERSLALFDLRDPRQPEHLGTCIFRNRGQGECAPEPTAQPARADLPAAQAS
ncbi:MAG TPA: hypothetical protein VFS21_07905 [Roseiflexaceae bacterium]|nr:hypothetical protein [Roseiflexaceae bacterium]